MQRIFCCILLQEFGLIFLYFVDELVVSEEKKKGEMNEWVRSELEELHYLNTRWN